MSTIDINTPEGRDSLRDADPFDTFDALTVRNLVLALEDAERRASAAENAALRARTVIRRGHRLNRDAATILTDLRTTLGIEAPQEGAA